MRKQAPVVLSRIALSLGVAAACSGSAAAQGDPGEIRHQGALSPGATSVTSEGSLFSLTFSGDETIRYQIDVAQPEIKGGLLRVYEATSRSYPLTIGGAGFRTQDGVARSPSWLQPHCTLAAVGATEDSLVLDYVDAIEGLHRRRHTFRIDGKTLRVRVQDLDRNTSFTSNYCGLYLGPTGQTPNPRLVRMQGALCAPLVLFEGAQKSCFFAHMLDLGRSHSSNWALPKADTVVPEPESIDFTTNTFGLYGQLSDGSMAAPLDDTLSLVVTSRLADALVLPPQPASPYLRHLEDRTVVMLTLNSSGLEQQIEMLELFHAWGLDQLAVYVFGEWSSSAADPPLNANLGPDWWPPRDPDSLARLMKLASARGLLLGLYTSFTVMPSSAPAWAYDLSRVPQHTDGSLKLSIQYSVPLMAEGAILPHAQREAKLLDAAQASLAFVDVSTYASPSKGADGDHLDQCAPSPWPKTLRAGIAARREWLRATSDGIRGPLLGEGSIATQDANLEWLWTGAVDSVQRTINTGLGKPAYKLEWNEPNTPTRWPVIPEFEQRVVAPRQAHHGNGLYERFFSVGDVLPGIPAPPAPVPLPLREDLIDRYRIYELTYGHLSFLQSAGPLNGTGNALHFADMIKEYYLVNALQAHYRASPISEILYEHAGALRTFEEVLFATGTTESFRHPRIRLAFQGGLTLWLNHGPEDWPVFTEQGKFFLPEDGFLALIPGTKFLAFSAAPAEISTKRIDYCLAPGRWEFFDGRGAVGGWGGLDTQGARGLAVHNFSRNLWILESAAGELQVKQLAPPALVWVEVDPPALDLHLGARSGLRALAHYANGSFRNVTPLVSWKVSDPAVISVDAGSILSACGAGWAEVGGSFEGVPMQPSLVSVH